MIEYALNFGFICAAVALLMNLWRLAKGPTIADRVLAVDTMAINAIALLVLYGISRATSMYFEGALLFAMFGRQACQCIGRQHVEIAIKALHLFMKGWDIFPITIAMIPHISRFTIIVIKHAQYREAPVTLCYRLAP